MKSKSCLICGLEHIKEGIAIETYCTDALKSRIAELEAQVAFLKHQKIVCCKCGKPFDVQYTCPACEMGVIHEGHEEHEGEEL